MKLSCVYSELTDDILKNINVVDKTITNISASGDTKFGDTADDIHQFTGSVYVNGAVSASSHLFGSALRTSGQLDATGSIKNKSFISSSGEVFAAGGLRTSGNAAISGTIKQWLVYFKLWRSFWSKY